MKVYQCWFAVLAACPQVTSFVIPSSARPRLTLASQSSSPAVITPTAFPLYKHTQMNPTRRDSSLSMMNLPSSLLANRAVLHGDPTFVLSAVLLLSTFGISLERRTVIGKALSAPLATMALALTVANLGFVPFTSPVCK